MADGPILHQHGFSNAREMLEAMVRSVSYMMYGETNPVGQHLPSLATTAVVNAGGQPITGLAVQRVVEPNGMISFRIILT